MLTFRPENCHIRSGRPYEETVRAVREIDADLIVLSRREDMQRTAKIFCSGARRNESFATRRARYLSHENEKRNRKRTAEKFAYPYHSGSHRFLAVCSSRDGIRRVSGKESSRYAAPVPRDVSLYELRVVDRAGVRLSGLAEAVEETVRQEMNALRQMDFLRGLPVQTELLPGLAVDEICAAAGDPEVDLIVTSTHGRTGLKHALIGSVAETRRPLRRAPGAGCPQPSRRILTGKSYAEFSSDVSERKGRSAAGRLKKHFRVASESVMSALKLCFFIQVVLAMPALAQTPSEQDRPLPSQAKQVHGLAVPVPKEIFRSLDQFRTRTGVL